MAHAARFRTSLALFGFTVPWWRAYVVHVQSVFYLFFLPFGVGMDIAKFVKLHRRVPGARPAAGPLVGAIMADRLIGFAVAATVAVLAVLAGGPGLSDLAIRVRWEIAVLFGVALLLIAGALWHWRAYLFAGWLLGAVGTARRRPMLVAVAVLASLGLFGVLSGCLWAAASVLGADLPYALALLVVSASMIFQALPISLAGVGGGELAMVGLLLVSGFARSEAVLLAAVFYGFRLTAALLGGAMELVGLIRPSGKA